MPLRRYQGFRETALYDEAQWLAFGPVMTRRICEWETPPDRVAPSNASKRSEAVVMLQL